MAGCIQSFRVCREVVVRQCQSEASEEGRENDVSWQADSISTASIVYVPVNPTVPPPLEAMR